MLKENKCLSLNCRKKNTKNKRSGRLKVTDYPGLMAFLLGLVWKGILVDVEGVGSWQEEGSGAEERCI